MEAKKKELPRATGRAPRNESRAWLEHLKREVRQGGVVDDTRRPIGKGTPGKASKRRWKASGCKVSLRAFRKGE